MTSAVAPPRHSALADRLLASVGQTPLIELTDLAPLPAGARVFAKLEAANPGGSIKDRPVKAMLAGALRRGDLVSGGDRRLLDSSSGNAGIAYAQFGAALGVPVTLVVPGNASRERLDRIAAYGAELILTDPIEGYDFAIAEARRLAAEQPERYWYCDQYSNEDNPRAHFEATGGEILAQVTSATGAPPDAFVGGVGTGGTITGVARRLRKARPDVHVRAIIPDVFPGIEGLKPLGEAGDYVPPILDESLITDRRPATIEVAIDTCMSLARRGLFVGPSSGAFVAAALDLACDGERKSIVTILCDTGERYGSTGMWSRA